MAHTTDLSHSKTYASLDIFEAGLQPPKTNIFSCCSCPLSKTVLVVKENYSWHTYNASVQGCGCTYNVFIQECEACCIKHHNFGPPGRMSREPALSPRVVYRWNSNAFSRYALIESTWNCQREFNNTHWAHNNAVSNHLFMTSYYWNLRTGAQSGISRSGNYTCAKWCTLQYRQRSFYPHATRCGGKIVTLLWFRLSVVPCTHGRSSVCLPCAHQRDYTVACFFVKLGRHVNHDDRMNPIDFGGQRSRSQWTYMEDTCENDRD